MSEYSVTALTPLDPSGQARLHAFLALNGIRRDDNLDYTCVLTDADGQWIATGSCYLNTLRCIAIGQAYQGEGLLRRIVSHLLAVQAARGNTHVFLYTKPDAAPRFADLGFFEVARVLDAVVFMENRRRGFKDFLEELKTHRRPGSAAAVVINANPFTLGHLCLVETTAAACDTLHLFVVSEDASLVPYPVRWRLVRDGVSHLGNVLCHATGPYLISNATFPSYFILDAEDVVREHARLDVQVFLAIAGAMAITRRFVGEEPKSRVTAMYNQVMQDELPRGGVALTVIPRARHAGEPVSASSVRQLLHAGCVEAIRLLVPDSTYRFFQSPEAQPVLARIRAAEKVVHD